MLLDMARNDLEALRGMRDSAVFAGEIFGFHAQQAVEKSVKAWLSVLGVSFPRTHDLEQLFALVEEHGDVVPDELRHLVDLTDFAVQYRYEAFTDLGEELDRPTLTERVEQLVRHVEKRLSELTG
jgi:HEPN domain-containing protein